MNNKFKMKIVNTSATMNANVLSPDPRKPTITQMRNSTPDRRRIVTSRASKRTWLHPGVVGEKDN